jgi:hypothetical protein
MASTVMAWKMAVAMSIRLTRVPMLPTNPGALRGRAARRPALLVRGGAERLVGLVEQPVAGDDALPGRVDARQAGAHLPVHGDRAAGAEAGSRVADQAGARPHLTMTSTRSGCRLTGWPSAATASTRSRPGSSGDALLTARTVHLDAVVGEVAVHQGAELGGHGGQALRAAARSG